MMNQIFLVGRVAHLPELQRTETGQKITTLTLAVSRSFKNINGEYETDFFNITLYNTIAETSTEYLQKGDIVGIKGRLQNTENNKNTIIADKVTFLSTKQQNENKEEHNVEEEHNIEEGEI